MSPLEYAQMLTVFNYRSFYDREGRQFCCLCGAFKGHDPRCWSHGLPKIVAALEAAEQVATYTPVHNRWCPYCQALIDDDEHRPGCEWQALVAALRGEA